MENSISCKSNDNYNTLDIDFVKTKVEYIITNAKLKSLNSYVVGFEQASIEVILEAYEPLINSLSTKISSKWKQIEFDDAKQICSMVMVELYNKGYYLNRKLLEKSFVNKVLMSIRHDRNQPDFVSLNDVCPTTDNNTYADIIEDKQQTEERIDDDVRDIRLSVFEDVREVILDYIGIRQFNQLLLEYGTGMTSNWGRKTMQSIKNYLQKNGYTKSSFFKDYI